MVHEILQYIDSAWDRSTYIQDSAAYGECLVTTHSLLQSIQGHTIWGSAKGLVRVWRAHVFIAPILGNPFTCISRLWGLEVEVETLLIVSPWMLSWIFEHSANLILWAGGNGPLFTTLWWPIVTLRFVLLTTSLPFPPLLSPLTRDDRGSEWLWGIPFGFFYNWNKISCSRNQT
jgi:hypothetical protein